MKVAFIAPVNALTYWGGITDYHMALTHLVLSNQAYRHFYWHKSRSGHYVILDNSVIELGASVEFNTLVSAAKLIEAKEIILPDVLDDSAATLKRAKECLYYAKHEGLTSKFRFMVVPQGKTLQEWIESYNDLKDLGVWSIGIPKRLGRLYRTSDKKEQAIGRAHVLYYLCTHDLIDTRRVHHLLGIYDNPVEIKVLSAYDWIRGVDSQLPFWAAANGIRFHPEKGLLERRNGRNIILDDDVKLDDDIVGHNILCMLRWANWWS